MTALLLITGITLTLMQCFQKWGWTQWYQARRRPWMPAAECNLCLAFWCGWLSTALYFLLSPFVVGVILIPLSGAGIINVLLTFYQALRHENH